MTDIENFENIIFNPLIYGTVIFEKNDFDDINNEDIAEFKIKSHFNNDVFINNNLNINTNSKININDTLINTDELVQVKNINQY